MKLCEVVEAYIAFKRALGVRLESEARVLRALCRSLGDIYGLCYRIRLSEPDTCIRGEFSHS